MGIVIVCEDKHVATELIKSIGECIVLKTVEGAEQQFQDNFTLKGKIFGLNMTEVY